MCHQGKTFILLMFIATLEVGPVRTVDDSRRPPELVSEFQKKRIFSDSSGLVYIHCEANGIPQPKYKFKIEKDNTQFTINEQKKQGYDLSNGTLSFKREKKFEGIYQCIAYNKWGTAFTRPMNVTKTEFQSFPKSGKGQSNNPHTEALTVGAAGIIKCQNKPKVNPLSNYLWHKGTDEVETDNRITVNIENGNLHIAYVLTKDATSVNAYYKCGLSNDVKGAVVYGSFTQVSVTGTSGNTPQTVDPVIRYKTESNSSKIGFYGQDFDLQCIFSGYPVSISWTGPLGSLPTGRFTLKNNNQLLKIHAAKEEDGGDYSCTPNSDTALRNTIKVYIKGGPIWIPEKQLKSGTFTEGETAKFYCRAMVLNPKKVLAKPKWMKNGEPLPKRDSRWTLSSDNTELTITNSSKKTDLCNIQCIIDTGYDKVYSNAYLNVLLEIKILLRPENQKVYKGDVIILPIEAEGDSSITLQYQWKFRGKDIVFFTNDIRHEAVNHSLIINTTGLSDTQFQDYLGVYTLQIFNNFQKKSINVTLIAAATATGGTMSASPSLVWLAPVIAIILLLIIIILVICLLYRNRGDEYYVDKKERIAGHNPEKELANSGLVDLQRTEDNLKKPDNGSISSIRKPIGSDDDNDSLEEYGDNIDIKFNEDGSFIDMYKPKTSPSYSNV